MPSQVFSCLLPGWMGPCIGGDHRSFPAATGFVMHAAVVFAQLAKLEAEGSGHRPC
jgi:hypothetical protein